MKPKKSPKIEVPEIDKKKASPAVPSTSVAPNVKASDLVAPPKLPTLSEPKLPNIPTSAITRARNVANETQNIITANTEEAKRRKEKLDELESFGQGTNLNDIREQELDKFGVDESVKELKDINLQLTDMDTSSELTKSQINSAGGQTIGQAQREVTQEDRENAVRQTGLAARAAVLQGNIETGRALANDAVSIAYQQRTLDQNNLITQLNEYGKIADEQTKQLVDQARAEAELEIKADDEMKANIANAIVRGASQSEIAQLNKQLPPDATAEQIAADRATKNALAQSIAARGANEDRSLDHAQKLASIDASKASAANSRMNSLIEQAKMGSPDALIELGITPNPDGYVSVTPKEAQDVQKEITQNPAYQAIRKGEDSLQALKGFEDLFNEVGLTNFTTPNDNKAVKAKYNAAILNLKEFFNLGVLNGPDEAILRGVLPSPADIELDITQKKAVETGIQGMKDQIEQTIDDRYLSVKTQYANYNPSDITLLTDLDRVYLQQKIALNPNVLKFIQENPDLPLEDALQVINTKF